MTPPDMTENKELSKQDILRFIVEKERLTKTLRHFGLTKDELRALFAEVAIEDRPPNSENSAVSSSDDFAAIQPKNSKKNANSKQKTTKVNRSKTASSKKSTQESAKKSAASEAPSKKAFSSKEDSSLSKKTSSNRTKKSDKETEAKKVSSSSLTPSSSKVSATKATAKSSSSSSSKAAKEEKNEKSTTKTASKTRKTTRRQSSPRGRRHAVLEPEHYVYHRLLIYSDGAARGNPGESGAGVVLKTPEGEEVGRFGRYLGRRTNNYAEYQAVLLGLRHAQEFGANEITILSDSDLLVRQLLGEYRVRAAHLKELFDQVKKLLTHFDKYQVKRIGREKNSEADSMANRAIDEKL